MDILKVATYDMVWSNLLKQEYVLQISNFHTVLHEKSLIRAIEQVEFLNVVSVRFLQLFGVWVYL